MANEIITSHGAFVYAKSTERFLFLLRQGRHKWAYHWGIVGGKQEADESPLETLQREAQEEIGLLFTSSPVPVDHYISADAGFAFHTYLYIVDQEFSPLLNHEHCGYCWVPIDKYPRPLHPGVFSTIRQQDTIDRLLEIIAVS